MHGTEWVEAPRLIVFITFLVLGFAVTRARNAGIRRRRINLLLICTLITHFEVGFSQIDCWPFSHYPLMRGVWNEHYHYSKIFVVGIDSSGHEWQLDPMTWSPVFPLVLQAWFQTYFQDLSPAQKIEVARFLYGKAERARIDTLAGRRFGNELLLGPLTAPDWWFYRRIHQAPHQPYAGVRVYQEVWTPAEKMVDPNRVQRVLFYEYRPQVSPARAGA